MNNVIYVNFNKSNFVSPNTLQLENLTEQRREKWAEFRKLSSLSEAKLSVSQFKPLMFLNGRERFAKLKTLTKSKKLHIYQ